MFIYCESTNTFYVLIYTYYPISIEVKTYQKANVSNYYSHRELYLSFKALLNLFDFKKLNGFNGFKLDLKA